MTTSSKRVDALVTAYKKRPVQVSPKFKADVLSALKWFRDNGSNLGILPREDMTKGERYALDIIIQLCKTI